MTDEYLQQLINEIQPPPPKERLPQPASQQHPTPIKRDDLSEQLRELRQLLTQLMAETVALRQMVQSVQQAVQQWSAIGP